MTNPTRRHGFRFSARQWDGHRETYALVRVEQDSPIDKILDGFMDYLRACGFHDVTIREAVQDLADDMAEPPRDTEDRDS